MPPHEHVWIDLHVDPLGSVKNLPPPICHVDHPAPHLIPLPSPFSVMLLHNLIRGLPQLLPTALLPAMIAAISAEGPDEAAVPPHMLPLYHDFRTAQVCVGGGVRFGESVKYVGSTSPLSPPLPPAPPARLSFPPSLLPSCRRPPTSFPQMYALPLPPLLLCPWPAPFLPPTPSLPVRSKSWCSSAT